VLVLELETWWLVSGSVLALLLAGHECRQRLNGFLHFSQRKTALSSRDELGGHGHEDSLRLGAPAVMVPLPVLCAWATLCTSKARRAESELEKF